MRGLTLLYLPPYSPQLNIIETLWKFMKYYWIEYSAFLSYDNLLEYIKKVFDNYGNEKYRIDFSVLEGVGFKKELEIGWVGGNCV